MLAVGVVQYIGMYTNSVREQRGTMEPQWIAKCVASVRRRRRGGKLGTPMFILCNNNIRESQCVLLRQQKH